jgi:divalent metal cation (Fe/Co/Zn/Cd) transporter
MKQQGWSAGRIALVLYPFAAGAAGVNVFFASLIGSWLGGPILSLTWSMAIGCVIGVPATFAFARHVRRLMDKADQTEPT